MTDRYQPGFVSHLLLVIMLIVLVVGAGFYVSHHRKAPSVAQQQVVMAPTTTNWQVLSYASFHFKLPPDWQLYKEGYVYHSSTTDDTGILNASNQTKALQVSGEPNPQSFSPQALFAQLYIHKTDHEHLTDEKVFTI